MLSLYLLPFLFHVHPRLSLPSSQISAFTPTFARLAESGKLLSLVPADPADGCLALRNSRAVAGAVALITRGNCYFSVKVANALQSGAAAVLIVNTDDKELVMTVPEGEDTSPYTIPAGALTKSVGDNFFAQLYAGNRIGVAFQQYDASQLNATYDVLDGMSSRGPTADGRIKPDIVAPGTLSSAQAYARDGCSAVVLSGTSMATPAVAAAAAQVRQYFVEGFHPQGSRGASRGFEPSGALVKAVLLNGATPLAGFEEWSGEAATEAPNSGSGFGRLDLSRSLPLAGLNRFKVAYVNSASLNKTGASLSFKLKTAGASAATPLRVTLVWYDYPADPAAGRTLVNDLDLTVVLKNKKTAASYVGNGQVDRLNTVERVTIDKPLPKASLTITVSAHRIYSKVAGQPFALVVTGNFIGTL